MSKKKPKRRWKQPGSRMARIYETSYYDLWRIAEHDNRLFIATVEEVVAEALKRRRMPADS